jgi:hypothetical protein
MRCVNGSLATAGAVAVLVGIVITTGCAPRDDSVWDRVERIDSTDTAREPPRHREIPPVITPGQAAQDSLDQPTEDRGEPGSSD